MIDVEHAVRRKRLKLADVLVEFRLIGARFHLHESSFIRCWQRHFYVDRLLRASDIALTKNTRPTSVSKSCHDSSRSIPTTASIISRSASLALSTSAVFSPLIRRITYCSRSTSQVVPRYAASLLITPESRSLLCGSPLMSFHCQPPTTRRNTPSRLWCCSAGSCERKPQ